MAKRGLLVTKVKVKVTLEQAMKAQRGSRGIPLLFLEPRLISNKTTTNIVTV